MLAAAVMFYISQQKTIVKAVISDNVEALVNDETPKVFLLKNNLCAKNSNGQSGGYLDVSKDISPIEDIYFCAGNVYRGDEIPTNCWIIVEYPDILK